MTEVIRNFLGIVYNDFKKNLASIKGCDLDKFSYKNENIPDYNNPIDIQYYLLKYFPAYLAEYKILYDKINYENFRKYENTYRVCSIGCGCGIDLIGLFVSKGKNLENIEYDGIDAIDWNYKDIIIKPSDTIRFHKAGIATYDFTKQSNSNVFIFPKSICEFLDADFDVFKTNLQSVDFTSSHIALLISAMDKGFCYDYTRYKEIIQIFCDKGYNIENILPMQEIKESQGIGKLVYGFSYPNEIIKELGSLRECCILHQDCEKECKLGNWPILRTDYMSFTYNILAK